MNRSSTLKSVLVAIGGSLVAIPASALELGDVRVQSALGQPLRASIAYALGPNEAISNSCVTVRPANSASGISSTDRGTLVIGNGQIEYTSNSMVREPLVAIQVAVSCHYTARLSRDYMLFVDPVIPAPVAAPAPQRVAVQTRAVMPPPRRAPAVAQEPAVAPRNVTEKAPVAEPTTSSPESTAYEPADVPEIPAEPITEVPVITTSRSPVAELQPGDVIIPTDNTYVEPVATPASEPVVAPEPQSIIRQPQPAPSDSSAPNWLLWLGAGGGAAALALFFLGRLLRDRFGSSPIAPAKSRREPKASEPEPFEPQVEPQAEPQAQAFADIDIEIDDDSPTAENLALDADLLKGTGLQEGSDVEIAQDFDFASTTELDLELPEEPAEATEVPMTDILPPLHADENEILDSEVLPEDDEYDFSVMLDATKMPNPDDVTERDLEAVQVHDDDDTLIGNDYTVSNEVDYKVLEQDYEDEMTATQALNEEIMKATEDTAVNDELDITAEVAANDLPKSGKKVS